MKNKEVAAAVLIVTYTEGKRKETQWNILSDKEKEKFSKTLTERFMTAAGCAPVEKNQKEPKAFHIQTKKRPVLAGAWKHN